MKSTIKRFINTQCVALGATIDFNTGFAIEVDFFFWTIDILFFETLRNPREENENIFSKREQMVKK